jgi:hypothetical protein
MKPEQVNDWTENPVTIFIKEQIELEIKTLQKTPIAEYLCAGDPQTTQERMIESDTTVRVWTDMVDVLNGDTEMFDDRN